MLFLKTTPLRLGVSAVKGAPSFFRLVKFEHTVFALPFALLGFLLASPFPIPWSKLVWVLLAMVGARSAAMAFNRLADLRFDAANPRTRSWPLVKGEVTVRSAWIFFAAMAALFFASAAALNRLTLLLSPAAFVWITGYSLAKRWTWACHLGLGLALAMAPVGGWLAVRPAFHPIPLLLALGVLFWAAGFDILYACQDVSFDREMGLHSIPARFGVGAALRAARGFHVAAAAAFAALAWAPGLQAGPSFWIGWTVLAGMLFYEHTLVRADDLSCLDAAFFTVNGLVSVLFFVFTILDQRILLIPPSSWAVPA